MQNYLATCKALHIVNQLELSNNMQSIVHG